MTIRTDLWDISDSAEEEAVVEDKFVLTKEKISLELCQAIGLNKREAKETVERLFSVMQTALSSGHPLKISGFGNFTFRDKGARTGRNPKTGEALEVMQRRVVVFSPSQKLRNHVDTAVDGGGDNGGDEPTT